ncbi:MAG: hypothetical protein ABIO24_02115, partial [Saprospiraceae bacterium]
MSAQTPQPDQASLIQSREETAIAITPKAASAVLSGEADPMAAPRADLSAPTHLVECEGIEEDDEALEEMKNELQEVRAEEWTQL